MEQAAQIAVAECLSFVQTKPRIERILFVCFASEVHEAYQQAFAELEVLDAGKAAGQGGANS